MPIAKGGGNSGKGGIFYSDEEIKNAEDNKRPIK